MGVSCWSRIVEDGKIIKDSYSSVKVSSPNFYDYPRLLYGRLTNVGDLFNNLVLGKDILYKVPYKAQGYFSDTPPELVKKYCVDEAKRLLEGIGVKVTGVEDFTLTSQYVLTSSQHWSWIIGGAVIGGSAAFLILHRDWVKDKIYKIYKTLTGNVKRVISKKQ